MHAWDSTSGRRPAAFAWRIEFALASCIATAVVCVALWDALLFASTRTLGNWEGFAQSNSLTQVEPRTDDGVQAAGDPLRQFVPWAVFARSEIEQGRFPLWCSASGAGVPLFANYQAAVLSPFTLPFYWLPLPIALLVSPAAKLFVAAASAFLLMRSLSCSRGASAVGATAYGLCGFHLICILHPHVGVLAILPLALLAVDRAALGHDAVPARLPLGALASLALTLGLLGIAGHPESFFFAILLVASFALYRVARAAWCVRRDRSAMRQARRFAFAVLVAGLVGGALSAVQWLPFLEYLFASSAYQAGGREASTTAASFALLQMFPYGEGTPLSDSAGAGGWTPMFDEANTYFVGATTTLFALGAVLFVRRAHCAPYFLTVALATVLYTCEAPFVREVLGPLLGAGHVLAVRTSPLWTMSVSVLAALTLDQLARNCATHTRWRAAVLSACGVVALIAGRAVLQRSWAKLSANDPSAFAPVARELERFLDVMSLTVGIGLVAALALTWSSRPLARRATWIVLWAATAVQCALPFERLNTAADDRYVVPRTAAVETLRERLDGERVVFLAKDAPQPNTNLFYDLALISSYDALEPSELSALRSELFGDAGYASVTVRASRFALELFGVRYVATRGEWLPLEGDGKRRYAQLPWYIAQGLGKPNRSRVVALDGSSPVHDERFVAARDGLDGLVVHFLDASEVHGARVTLELAEVGGSVPIARRVADLGELHLVPGGRRECVLDLPPLARSTGVEYAFTVRAEGVPTGARVELCARPRATRPPSPATGDGEDGRVVLDLSYGRAAFERAGKYGGYVLHRLADSPGRAWIVTGVLGVDGSEAALERTLRADFDPHTHAVLEGVPASEPRAGDFALECEREVPGAADYRASCSEPAFLVLAQTYSAGWKVRVDGVDAPLLRANSAFTAVALPRGDSLVEFSYEPASFRVGLSASLVGLVLVALTAWAAARARRKTAPAGGGRGGDAT